MQCSFCLSLTLRYGIIFVLYCTYVFNGIVQIKLFKKTKVGMAMRGKFGSILRINALGNFVQDFLFVDT